MTRRFQPLAITGLAACAGALALQGCASTPKPVAAPAQTAAPAPSQIVTMAPIPNPTEPEHTHTAHPAASRHTSTSETKPPETPAPAAKVAATHGPGAQDHARAARLRAQGLEQLNRGAIDRAVSLLQAAARLDPSNSLIQRDLERAMRISRAVHLRH